MNARDISLNVTLGLSMLTSISANARALTPEELALQIESTYNPTIQYRTIDIDQSLYGCEIEEFKITGIDPITQRPRPAKLSLYKASADFQNHPTVLILPPTGGVNILDRGYANSFCSSGINGAIITDWEHQNETSLEFDMHDKGALRLLTATRHAVELLNSLQNKFSSPLRPIGLLGTSVGAIGGALVLGFESRIASTALIVGSSRFADVIAESTEKGATHLRQARMKKFGFKTLEEYKLAVQKAVRIEPGLFLKRAKIKSALTVTATEDLTVPTAYQHELTQQLDAQVQIVKPGEHTRVIKDTFWQNRNEIVEFFKNSLN